MCIGCTITKYWVPVIQNLESDDEKLKTLPNDIRIGIELLKKTAISEHINMIEAAHISFLDNHTLHEGDENNFGQKIPPNEVENYWGTCIKSAITFPEGLHKNKQTNIMKENPQHPFGAPTPSPVLPLFGSEITNKFSSGDEKKYGLRSRTPRGFAGAFYEANH